jgi:hypothetical protein
MDSAQASHITIYLSVVFGFIVVAYVAGAKLTRLQVSICYVVFTLFAALEIFRIVAYGIGTNRLVQQGLEWGAEIGTLTLDPKLRVILSTVLWSVGAIGALLFMWSVRHPTF